MAEGRAGLRVWDRLVLVVAWTVTCGFVYLLGVSVGRGTQDQHARPEERVVKLPVNVPAPAPGTPAGATDEVTFYEKLVSADRTHDRAADPKTAPVVPAPADGGAPAKVTKPVVTTGAAAGLLAAARVVGANQPAAAVPAVTPKPPAVAAAGKPNPAVIASATPKATAPAKAVVTPPKTAATAPKPALAVPPKPATAAVANATVTPDAPTKPTLRAAPAPRPEPTATANAKPPGDAAVPAAAPKKNWTVTASGTADRYEAEALMHQLKSKGYAAAMVQTAKNGVTQYRVRVGRYGSSTEAADAARKLQREGLQGATPASTE